MNLLAAAGVIGLVGSRRRARPTVATTTRNTAIALVATGAFVSIVAGVL